MKKIVAKILCSNIIGGIISIIFSYKIPNIRSGFKRYYAPKQYCNNAVRAMIFWGIYERAEVRLVHQYMPKNIPVIELGSSLGVVSSMVNQIINNETNYTCVEANPYLIDAIKTNILRYSPHKRNLNVINAAIAYNMGESIQMNFSNNNTESSIYAQSTNANAKSIKTLSLSSIAQNNFTLICDIEGAEIGIFKEDKQAFENCKHMFIELHATAHNNKKYSVSDLKNLIVDELHFKLIKADGNVFYFSK